DLHDRELGDVELLDDGLLGVRRQVGTGEVDLFPDLLERLLHVHVDLELGDDVRVALDGRGGQLLDVRDGVEVLLDDARDQGLDVLRSHARIDRGDRDDRDHDLGARLLGHRAVRHDAEQRDDRRQHEHARVLAHREVREGEAPLAAVAGRAAVLAMPGPGGAGAAGHGALPSRATSWRTSPAATCCWPITTRRSPAWSPDSTTMRFIWAGPSSSGRASAMVRPPCSTATYAM